MAACGCCRSSASSGLTLGGLAGPAMRPASDRFDHASVDELAERGFWYADVTADVSEPDAPLRDEPPGKPRLGPEDMSGFLQGQKLIGFRGHLRYRASFGWVVCCQGPVDAGSSTG